MKLQGQAEEFISLRGHSPTLSCFVLETKLGQKEYWRMWIDSGKVEHVAGKRLKNSSVVCICLAGQWKPLPVPKEVLCVCCITTLCFTPAQKPGMSRGVCSFSNQNPPATLRGRNSSAWSSLVSARARGMIADCHIIFCSYCPGRHSGRNLQPSETDHRGTVWSLHLGSSKGKIMKTDFYFSFSNWHHLLHLTTLKPFQWSLPLALSSVVHTLTITFCSSHNALHLVSLLV